MKDRSLLGLLALLATLLGALVGCPESAAASGQEEVHVTLSTTTIHSSQTTFSPGVSYHFVVTNQGQAVHEFMIVPMGLAPSAMNGNALAMINSVASGETKTIDYTFSSSTVGHPWSLRVSCTNTMRLA